MRALLLPSLLSGLVVIAGAGIACTAATDPSVADPGDDGGEADSSAVGDETSAPRDDAGTSDAADAADATEAAPPRKQRCPGSSTEDPGPKCRTPGDAELICAAGQKCCVDVAACSDMATPCLAHVCNSSEQCPTGQACCMKGDPPDDDGLTCPLMPLKGVPWQETRCKTSCDTGELELCRNKGRPCAKGVCEATRIDIDYQGDGKHIAGYNLSVCMQ